MAIVRSLAIGKAVNSAGNLTYQTVKGRTIAREKPVHVHNPNTARQQEQRSKMRNLVAAWRSWFSLLKPYFTVIDGFGSEYNQFVKMNMPFAETILTNPSTGEIEIEQSAYMANGKYPQRALSSSGAEVTVEDIQLQQEAEVGDQFVVIQAGDMNENPSIKNYVLTESDINKIRLGQAVDTGLTVEPLALYGWLFYSSARRTSSTLLYSV